MAHDLADRVQLQPRALDVLGRARPRYRRGSARARSGRASRGRRPTIASRVAMAISVPAGDGQHAAAHRAVASRPRRRSSSSRPRSRGWSGSRRAAAGCRSCRWRPRRAATRTPSSSTTTSSGVVMRSFMRGRSAALARTRLPSGAPRPACRPCRASFPPSRRPRRRGSRGSRRACRRG